MKGLAEAGIVDLQVAFSRNASDPKDYVQDRIFEHKDDVWDLFEAGAIIYVCGDASRMAPDVRRTFAAIYAEKAGVTLEDAAAWIDRIAAEGGYLVDVWSAS